ncbi:hypothetical protein XAC3810_430192 [Xanthomonas citri pv. citri]|nr:hypothetical protein XAC1083_430216 [Xanthomonas citri pv. citri]CEE38628.1 hypothetical protein XAC3810_430192 [Xanthomonas citri pv. citri]CEE41768.1 hypothetical protein XAC2911_440050 [Xanthomonas citri pv. citri]CEE44464.1 hypothetical protein XAC908_610049 [Xanthomonas citri pv. citri]CEE58406.1 hypothetical protein XAC2852_1420011 [Xanthomonas citri pv. citri]
MGQVGYVAFEIYMFPPKINNFATAHCSLHREGNDCRQHVGAACRDDSLQFAIGRASVVPRVTFGFSDSPGASIVRGRFAHELEGIGKTFHPPFLAGDTENVGEDGQASKH